MPKNKYAVIRTKAGAALNRLKNNKFKLLIAFIIPACVIAAVFTLSSRRSYSLNPAVTHGIFTIPVDAVWYCEILEPQELYTIFETSVFGKSVIESKAWEKLAGTPEFHTISNLLYFIELKAGISIKYSEIPSFLGGSAGMAKMKDGSVLIVAKTNIKSKFGLALVTAFKGETIPLSNAAKKAGDGKKLEGITADSYADLFAEENISFANLTVTKINVQNGFLYLVMMGDYLFVSDSADTLKESLYLAAQSDPSSLKKIDGMTDAITAFEKGGHIFFYMDAQNSAAAPLLSAFVKGESGAAFVLYPDREKGLTGDIFAIGDTAKESANENTAGFSKIIPLEQTVTLYSESAGIKEILASSESLGKTWSDLKDGEAGFFRGADIDTGDYFGDRKGTAVVFHSLDIIAKKPYPQFSLLYSAKQTDERFIKAIFKCGDAAAASFQGIPFSLMSPAAGARYTPSLYDGKHPVISSSRADCEKFISASKGNRPVLADDPSYTALGEYSAAPHHLIISVPRAIDAARSFFNYGAQRNGGYSAVTVERDIMPLSEPLARYETLHIASGLAKRKTGRIVLTEKKK